MIKSQITLKQLEAFVFVVDAGTFRSAADMLGTTQPNISARIAGLEDALGAKLLNRDAGSVRMTAKGEELLIKAREVIWAGEELLEAAGRQDALQERLRLGVTELVACTWLQAYLKVLRGKYPKLKVELQVDLSARIEDRLLAGHLDLAFQSAPFATKTSDSLRLGAVPYVWVARPDAGLATDGIHSLTDLFHYSVMTHARNTGAGDALHETAKALGLDRGQIVHSSALSACLPMVIEGLAIGVLPASLVRSDLDAGALVEIKADWVPPDLEFFARFHSERSARFVAHAAEMALEVFA